MKLFFSDREPRPTPAVCGPPTDLSFYNASLSPTHRDYHRRNVFLRQRRALQLETATEQRTTVLLPLLFLGDRDSDRHRRAGSPFRSRALRIIGCGIADGWRGEKISSTPIRRDGYRRQRRENLPRSVPVKGFIPSPICAIYHVEGRKSGEVKRMLSQSDPKFTSSFCPLSTTLFSISSRAKSNYERIPE